MTTTTQPTIIKGPVIRKCRSDGEYLDDGIAACPDCGTVGALVGKAS